MSIHERAARLRSSQWPIVLSGGIGLWLAAMAVSAVTGNTVLLPTDMLAGSFVVPVTAVVWLYERNATPALTPRRVVVAFLGGGGLSMLVAALLENWLLPSGTLRFAVIGTVEELAKAALLLVCAYGVGRRDARTGLVLGTAVGFGYAALESSGYALAAFDGLTGSTSGLANMLQIEAERAVLAPLLHGLWTAVVGAAMFRATSRPGRLRTPLRVAAALLLVIALHTGWDAMDNVAAYVAAALPTSTVASTQLTPLAYWGTDIGGSFAVCVLGAATFIAPFSWAPPPGAGLAAQPGWRPRA